MVGTIDVDVHTGSMDTSEEKIKQITCCALEMVKDLPPYQPRQSVPEEFVPKDMPQAELIEITNDETLE